MSGEWEKAIEGCEKPSLNIVTDDVLTEGSKSVSLGVMSVDMPWPIINTSNASAKVDEYVDKTGEYVSCAINNYNVKPVIEKMLDQASQVDYSNLIDDIREDIGSSVSDIKDQAINTIKDNSKLIRSGKDKFVGMSTTIMIILSCFVTLIGGLFIYLAI